MEFSFMTSFIKCLEKMFVTLRMPIMFITLRKSQECLL